MRPIKSIAIIGATGRLGTPVAKELAQTFRLRAIVRSPKKALEKLPANVEIVKGDLRDVESLRAGLEGMDAIYVNLATETVNLKLPFYEEREGIQNIMTAIQGLDIQYIAKIGALGAYPPAVKSIKSNMIPNFIRIKAHESIAASGISHTFFAPTHFMELLPMMINKKSLQWIGNTNVQVYWISAVDYARQVAQAFQKTENMPEHCSIQGPELLSIKEAISRFIENYDPTLKIRVAPLWVFRFLGFFSAKMKFIAHLFAYFGSHEDPFYAAKTWELLGKPTMTVEIFAKGLAVDLEKN